MCINEIVPNWYISFQTSHNHKKMSEQRKLLKLSEMADYLRRTAEEFRREVVKYAIPHVKIGTDQLFDSQEVVVFLASQVRDSSGVDTKVLNSKLNTGDSRKKSRLGLAEAAKFLSVSKSTLYRWVRERRIPFYRLKRKTGFSQR